MIVYTTTTTMSTVWKNIHLVVVCRDENEMQSNENNKSFQRNKLQLRNFSSAFRHPLQNPGQPPVVLEDAPFSLSSLWLALSLPRLCTNTLFPYFPLSPSGPRIFPTVSLSPPPFSLRYVYCSFSIPAPSSTTNDNYKTIN